MSSQSVVICIFINVKLVFMVEIPGNYGGHACFTS